MYIGNSPLYQSFITDTFSGNGSTTAFTMTVAPANTPSVLVAVSGVLQDPSTYGVAGTTLTFSGAPPTGTGNISVRYLGIPASGVTTASYRTVTEFTATASQTTFTPASYTPGFINVYRNGSLLGSADYTATNGTTVVLAVGATVGDLVSVESFYVSSVLNAIPATSGSISSTYLAADSVTATQIAAGAVGSSELAAAAVGPTNLNGAQTGSAPVYGARAWVNFNGTGTVAIRASGNVSSITDNGTGLYTVNFTTAMPDADFAATLNSDDNSGNEPQILTFRSSTASTLLIGVWRSGFGRSDPANCQIAVFR
jgi:hypothetical protein